MDAYLQFLNSKINLDHRMGFAVDDRELTSALFPHQRDLVKWALEGGRRAIFAAFGLGKSNMQLEILRLIQLREGGRQLIVAPLGVRQEFMRDGREFFGIELKFVRWTAELGGDGLYITNYESIRDGRLSTAEFNAVSLDEASVLRSYGSKTYQNFLTLFNSVKYRFVATATPSPNRYKELIHYAGFLGIMDTGQALTRFFQRDSTKANNLTLYPHKEHEFWLWVSSWAIFLQKPSDLGYDDSGYQLPELHIHYHEVHPQHKRSVVNKMRQVELFADAGMNLQVAAKVKHDSLPERLAELVNIVRAHPNDHILLWHDQESERHALKKALPEAVAVYGSLDLELREQRIIDFSEGRSRYLATKPILSGSGCNFQRHCHRAIYLGIGFKFNDFIQSVHRIYRFMQTAECHIHLIYSDDERSILRTLQSKWDQHKTMVNHMTDLIQRYGLSHAAMQDELRRSIGIERVAISGQHWTAINNDTVAECRDLDSDSIDLIHTSIPFGNHYEYSPSYNDFGHNEDNARFFEQMDFLSPNLLRILKPGRVFACHVKDRIRFGNVTGTGMPTVEPFHSDCIRHYIRHGFAYMGMITVVTDVVRENNQTYRLGWTEQCKDGSKMGVGSPEYILLFRKLPSDTSTAYADLPVTKSKSEYSRARWQVDAHAFWRSSGDRLLSVDELSQLGPDKLARAFTETSLRQIYNYQAHVKIGEALELRGSLPSTFMAIAPGSHHPEVWHDINRMRTLNGSQSQKHLAQHVCPLQLDIVDRIITRYSNPGELVFDPFGGLMTVPYRALKLGRRGIATELNTDYFLDGVEYLRAAELEMNMPSLFDDLDIHQAA